MGHISHVQKIEHRPNTTKSMALNVEFCHKSDHANSIVNKYDYINLNVMTVTMVKILNYGYGINSIEQCAPTGISVKFS